MGRSNNWPIIKTVGGILSPDPQENSHFYEANMVYVPYCSSDSWSGTNTAKNSEGLTFMGRLILTEVIKELSQLEQLLNR